MEKSRQSGGPRTSDLGGDGGVVSNRSRKKKWSMFASSKSASLKKWAERGSRGASGSLAPSSDKEEGDSGRIPEGTGVTRFGLERKPATSPKVEYFYVIKENKFGKRQRRRVMVERPGKSSGRNGTGSRGRLRLLDERGLCKRNFPVDEIEKITSSVSLQDMSDDEDGSEDDDYRSSGGASRMSSRLSGGGSSSKPTVKLHFRGGKKSTYKHATTRTLFFGTESECRKFCQCCLSLNILVVVQRGVDSPEESYSASAHAAGISNNVAARPQHSISIGSACSSASQVHGRDWGPRYYVTRCNKYGQGDECMLMVSARHGSIRIVPLSAAESESGSDSYLPDYPLTSLSVVIRHAAKGTALTLRFADESEVWDERLIFEVTTVRATFISRMLAQMGERRVHVATDATPFTLASTQAEFGGWARFDVHKLNKFGKGKMARTYVVNVAQSVVHIFKTTELPSGLVTEDVNPHKTFYVIRGALHVERLSDNPKRLRMNTFKLGNEEESATLANFTDLEFSSVAELKRFAAFMDGLANPLTPLSVEAQRKSLEVTSRSSKPISRMRSMGLLMRHSNRNLLSPKPGRSSPTVPGSESGANVHEALNRAWFSGEVEWFKSTRRIFIGTFNVGDASPVEDSLLEHWIPKPNYGDLPKSAAEDVDVDSDGAPAICTGCSLYVFGFQESNTKYEEWSRSLAKFLGKGYSIVSSYRMWEIGIVIFAVNSEVPNISSVVAKHEATGLGIAKGYTGVQLGNKGGVAIGFKWYDVSVCFINAHLAAKPHRVKERNADYSQIVSKLQMACPGNGGAGLQLPHSYEHTFFLGDLNYRIDFKFQHTVELVARGAWDTLHTQDQLLREIREGNSFCDFYQELPRFIPTYRWQRNRREFSNKKEQSPSYTDRVLWHSRAGAERNVRMLSLTCAEEIMCSDHRPVAALMELDLRMPYMPWPVHPLNFPKIMRQSLKSGRPASTRRASSPTFGSSDASTSFLQYINEDGSYFVPETQTDGPCLLFSNIQVVLADREGMPSSVRVRVNSPVMPAAVVSPKSVAGIEDGKRPLVRFMWNTSLPRSDLVIWDPLYVCTQHIMFSIHPSQNSDDGAGADLATLFDSMDVDRMLEVAEEESSKVTSKSVKKNIFGQASLSLRPCVNAVRDMLKSQTVPEWTAVNAPRVPFCEKIIWGGVKIGDISGEVMFAPPGTRGHTRRLSRRNLLGGSEKSVTSGADNAASIVERVLPAKKGWVHFQEFRKRNDGMMRMVNEKSWKKVWCLLGANGRLYMLSRPISDMRAMKHVIKVLDIGQGSVVRGSRFSSRSNVVTIRGTVPLSDHDGHDVQLIARNVSMYRKKFGDLSDILIACSNMNEQDDWLAAIMAVQEQSRAILDQKVQEQRMRTNRASSLQSSTLPMPRPKPLQPDTGAKDLIAPLASFLQRVGQRRSTAESESSSRSEPAAGPSPVTASSSFRKKPAPPSSNSFDADDIPPPPLEEDDHFMPPPPPSSNSQTVQVVTWLQPPPPPEPCAENAVLPEPEGGSGDLTMDTGGVALRKEQSMEQIQLVRPPPPPGSPTASGGARRLSTGSVSSVSSSQEKRLSIQKAAMASANRRRLSSEKGEHIIRRLSSGVATPKSTAGSHADVPAQSAAVSRLRSVSNEKLLLQQRSGSPDGELTASGVGLKSRLKERARGRIFRDASRRAKVSSRLNEGSNE